MQKLWMHKVLLPWPEGDLTRSSVKLPKSQAPMGAPSGPSGGSLLKR